MASEFCTTPCTPIVPALLVTFLLNAGVSLQAHAEESQKTSLAETRLTLEESMKLAERHAYTARIATATVDETSSQRWQTLASMGPSLSLESTQVWISKDVNKMVGKTVGSTTVPDRVNTASLVAAQPIVPLGPLYMKLKIDLASHEVAKLDEVQSARNARFSGAETFIKAQKAEEFLKIAEASLRLVEKQRRDGEALYNAGKLASVDVLRLDMALSDAKTQEAQARNIRELSLVVLAETLGIKHPESITLAPETSALAERYIPGEKSTDDLVAKALTNRTEIKGAEARIEAAKLYKMAADFDYIPMVNAFAKYDRDFEKDDMVVYPLHSHLPAAAGGINVPNKKVKVTVDKEDIRDSFSYGLSIKWTLWDWGQRVYRSNEMAAGIQKATLVREQVESGVRLEATQAFLDFQYAKSALETGKATLKFAEEAYRQQNARFQNGAATVTDIITAERDQTRARGGLSNAVGDLDIALLKLYRVSGQDFTNNR
jgi:outer membrane protein TolC